MCALHLKEVLLCTDPILPTLRPLPFRETSWITNSSERLCEGWAFNLTINHLASVTIGIPAQRDLWVQRSDRRKQNIAGYIQLWCVSADLPNSTVNTLRSIKTHSPVNLPLGFIMWREKRETTMREVRVLGNFQIDTKVIWFLDGHDHAKHI